MQLGVRRPQSHPAHLIHLVSDVNSKTTGKGEVVIYLETRWPLVYEGLVRSLTDLSLTRFP